jgi:hypothetical protein
MRKFTSITAAVKFGITFGTGKKTVKYTTKQIYTH